MYCILRAKIGYLVVRVYVSCLWLQQLYISILYLCLALVLNSIFNKHQLCTEIAIDLTLKTSSKQVTRPKKLALLS